MCFSLHPSVAATWRLESVLALASFPAALTGTNLAIFAATFSYLADITSTSDRTLRIAILDGTYLAAMPTGIAIGKDSDHVTSSCLHQLSTTTLILPLFLLKGSLLFSTIANKSFTFMFAVNTAIMACTLLYSLFRLKWRTSDSQRPLKGGELLFKWKCCIGKFRAAKQSFAILYVSVNIFSDFFDWKHVWESVRAVVRRRANHGRLYLILIILSMGLYTFQRRKLKE